MKKGIVISLLFLLLGNFSNAQDEHYSQFGSMPVALNPAESGSGVYDFRATLDYRKQWTSITNGYISNALSTDFRITYDKKTNNSLGVGLSIVQDKSGVSNYRQLQALATVAYSLVINNNNRLACGVGIGADQRSLNFDGLRWDSQYNGVGYDPSLPTNEAIALDKTSNIDASFGLLWRHKMDHYGYKYLHIGYSASHFLQDVTFLSNTESILPIRHALYSKFQTPIKYMLLTADAYIFRQAGTMLIQAGGYGTFRFGDDSQYTNFQSSSAIIGGLSYRYGDAIIPMIGYEYQRYLEAKFSYDINISKLTPATRYKGAWEVSLTYTGWVKPIRKRIPSF